MAPQDKPYRVYKGGRTKGKVPAVPGKTRPAPQRPVATSADRRRSWWPFRRRRVKGRRWKQIVLFVLLAVVVFAIVWGVLGFLAFRSGVDTANKRFDSERGARAALSASNGFLLTHSTTILLLGTDSSTASGRSGDRHADSIMIIRTDPSQHRLAYLSLPRDLLVAVPGVGNTKINASYQYGGTPLAIQTVRNFTGIPIDHVIEVDFNSFKDLIDAEGGITVNVPEPILSNRFDCPYKTQARCLQWRGWRFARGTQHMAGERALIYSRIRENQLNPGENDLTRGARQQAVTQAATAKLTSVSTLMKLPFDGKKLMSPLTTDLTTAQMLELGWVKFRADASHTLYCRLGGEPADAGGAAVIIPSEDNRSAIAMWDGLSAPQPPTSTYGPGCRTGHPLD
jgi:polyisoprenyl-teichoic acid--peptidoglycan teichoic acid transferase